MRMFAFLLLGASLTTADAAPVAQSAPADYYQILDIPPNSDLDRIEAARARILIEEALKPQPDRLRLMNVEQAYQALRIGRYKNLYDELSGKDLEGRPIHGPLSDPDFIRHIESLRRVLGADFKMENLPPLWRAFIDEQWRSKLQNDFRDKSTQELKMFVGQIVGVIIANLLFKLGPAHPPNEALRSLLLILESVVLQTFLSVPSYLVETVITDPIAKSKWLQEKWEPNSLQKLGLPFVNGSWRKGFLPFARLWHHPFSVAVVSFTIAGALNCKGIIASLPLK